LVGDIGEDSGATGRDFVFGKKEQKAGQEVIDGNGGTKLLEVGSEGGGGGSGFPLVLIRYWLERLGKSFRSRGFQRRRGQKVTIRRPTARTESGALTYLADVKLTLNPYTQTRRMRHSNTPPVRPSIAFTLEIAPGAPDGNTYVADIDDLGKHFSKLVEEAS
jgi:hypothetical protein